MVAASRSRPRSRLHSPTETSRNEGASDGEATPSISTVSSRPPASASAVQRIFVAVSTARRSVPVQSRRTSVVAVETRVSSPLMIGGNERTRSSASTIRGKRGASATRWAKARPFG